MYIYWHAPAAASVLMQSVGISSPSIPTPKSVYMLKLPLDFTIPFSLNYCMNSLFTIQSLKLVIPHIMFTPYSWCTICQYGMRNLTPLCIVIMYSPIMWTFFALLLLPSCSSLLQILMVIAQIKNSQEGLSLALFWGIRLSVISLALNPLLYGLLARQYRMAYLYVLRRLFSLCCPGCVNPPLKDIFGECSVICSTVQTYMYIFISVHMYMYIYTVKWKHLCITVHIV